MSRTTRTHSQRIAALNDALRRSIGIPVFGSSLGRAYITAGIQTFLPEEIVEIWARVRDYADFTPDNDPYVEHDFGAFTYDGETIFWKIDYYTPDLKHGSPDPADPAQTVRILTVMLAEEY